MKHKQLLLYLSFLCISITLLGCTQYNPDDIKAFYMPRNVNVTADDYILQPPDEIEIHSSKVPEIHLQIQQIRPDGKVSFEGIGELQAAGKTPRQLAEQIREKVMFLYALAGDQPINVRVIAYRSKFYYVIGQVYFEGPIEITGRDTLLNALAKARPTILAWTDKVRVIRPSDQLSLKPKIFEVNYKDMVKRGDLSKNIMLEEGDIVYVPPTILAAIGMLVEEAVRPVARAFGTVNIVQASPNSKSN